MASSRITFTLKPNTEPTRTVERTNESQTVPYRIFKLIPSRFLHENLLDLKSQVAHFIVPAIENRAYDIQALSHVGTTASCVCEIHAGKRF